MRSKILSPVEGMELKKEFWFSHYVAFPCDYGMTLDVGKGAWKIAGLSDVGMVAVWIDFGAMAAVKRIAKWHPQKIYDHWDAGLWNYDKATIDQAKALVAKFK